MLLSARRAFLARPAPTCWRRASLHSFAPTPSCTSLPPSPPAPPPPSYHHAVHPRCSASRRAPPPAAPAALSVFDGLAARSAPRFPTARFAGSSPARPHLAGTGVCLGCFAPRLAVARYTRRPCAAINMIRGLLYSSHPRGWGLRLCASLGEGPQCKAESSRVILERRSRLLRQGIL